ncbi:MAG TPA: zinc metallopeptidase [Candidatus Eubacterium faecipullorum]|uniref:Zinc metallopeptidase n=1 Tax=Candidatus Eubacterium faecipullorum TaxID=2838571 RepID=A0A9D1UF04_9FIRM|nr:zinc metallopeptidase [Candidatus Eubacterium faecipullorum]
MDLYIYYLTGFIMIPVVIFAFICQIKVNSNYKKYSKIRNARNMTGAQAAYELLQMNGVTDVRIKRIAGNLTDHYNPRTKEICLSEGVFNSNSIAAVGIACHEAGHACQHAKGYFPLKIRNMVIPVTRFGSYLGIPLALIGIFINWQPLVYVGIILYAAVALFQLITLPVEFNASKRALQTIKANGFLIGTEYTGAKKVLTAAALTYVAALASALATLLRLLLVAGRRR